MSIVDKVITLVVGMLTTREFPVCGEDASFVDPDNFNNFSDHDSRLVDSKEGAPE